MIFKNGSHHDANVSLDGSRDRLLLTTLDSATATRVVSINLHDLPAAESNREAQGNSSVVHQQDVREEARAEGGTDRLVNGKPLTQGDMLKAFRAMREVRRHAHEDEMVIDSIVDDARPNSLRKAIESA